MDAFGKAISKNSDMLSLFLKFMSEMTIDAIHSWALLRAVMNQCLVQLQQPVRHGRGLLPVHVIQRCIESRPSLVHSVDGHGRLPLHYVVNRTDVTDEVVNFILKANPEAASCLEPVSRLYPFMMAAAKGNAAVAFQPRRVQTPAAGNDSGKKRRRVLSLEQHRDV